MLSWYNNRSVQTKIIGSFVLIALLLCAVAAVAYSGLRTAGDDLDRLYTENLKPVEYLGAARAALQRIPGDSLVFATMYDLRSDAEPALNTDMVVFQTQLDAFRGAARDAKAQVLLKTDLDPAWAAYQKEILDTVSNVKAGVSAYAMQSIRPGGRGAQARDAINSALEQLITSQTQAAERSNQQSQARVSAAIRISLTTIAVAGLFLAIAMAIVVARSITLPLAIVVKALKAAAEGNILQGVSEKEKDVVRGRTDELGVLGKSMTGLTKGYLSPMVDAADQLAAGDLTAAVAPRSDLDVLGKSLAQMITNLRGVVGQILDSAEQVHGASGQLASTSEQAGSATSQVTATIQQVAQGTSAQGRQHDAGHGLDGTDHASCRGYRQGGGHAEWRGGAGHAFDERVGPRTGRGGIGRGRQHVYGCQGDRLGTHGSRDRQRDGPGHAEHP